MGCVQHSIVGMGSSMPQLLCDANSKLHADQHRPLSPKAGLGKPQVVGSDSVSACCPDKPNSGQPPNKL